MAIRANQPTQKGFYSTSMGFTDAELKLGVVVAESFSKAIFQALTDHAICCLRLCMMWDGYNFVISQHKITVA